MREQVKAVLAIVLGVDIESIPDDATVGGMTGWDSLKHVQLLMALEDEFEISFEDDEIKNLISIDAIGHAILQRQRSGADRAPQLNRGVHSNSGICKRQI